MTHKLSITGIALLVVSLLLVGVASVQAQTIGQAQIDRIKDNCSSVKNIVSQLQTSDTLLRINRGQLYEYISTKLMDKFNTRVSSNHFNNVSLVAVKDYYDNLLQSFRNDFQVYIEQTDAVLKIDCDQKPTEFYSAILDAREKRQQVHNDIIRLNQNISEYRSTLDAFSINFNRVGTGV